MVDYRLLSGTPEWKLALAAGVAVERGEGLTLTSSRAGRVSVLRGLPAGVEQALITLKESGPSGEDDLALLAEDFAAQTALNFWLHRLTRTGWLSQALFVGTQPLLSVVACSSAFSGLEGEAPAAPDAPLRLSRFAYARREEQGLVVESPLSPAVISLAGWRGAELVWELASGATCRSISERASELPLAVVTEAVRALRAARLLESANDRADDEADSLVSWEFHDLLFHAASRMGRHARPVGGTYRLAEKMDPLPAVKPCGAADAISLPRPDPDAAGPGLFSLLEQRRSLRRYGTEPLTLAELAEFLYRAATVRSVTLTDRGEVSSRPYPAAGAEYELEVYPLVNRCQGLEPGLYHYDPLEHQLHLVAAPGNHTAALLAQASAAAQLDDEPQVLLVIASRFGRTAWKYESIAYSLTLKDTGVLYQTMYLVAEALGLAPCALGAGDSDLFAAAAGLDYYAETSVGEFLLGSRPVGETA